jgi:hypothetical protein
LVEKSKEMNRISTDILGTSIKIHKRMWWKNKKVIIGIIAGVLVVLAAVVLVIVI